MGRSLKVLHPVGKVSAQAPTLGTRKSEASPLLSPEQLGDPLGARLGPCRSAVPGWSFFYLLRNSTRWQPLQVFQVGVEQGAMEQAGTQKSFHNVSHGAVVRQPNPLCCVHETA